MIRATKQEDREGIAEDRRGCRLPVRPCDPTSSPGRLTRQPSSPSPGKSQHLRWSQGCSRITRSGGAVWRCLRRSEGPHVLPSEPPGCSRAAECALHGLRPAIPVEVEGEPARGLDVPAAVRGEVPLGLLEAVDRSAVVAEGKRQAQFGARVRQGDVAPSLRPSRPRGVRSGACAPCGRGTAPSASVMTTLLRAVRTGRSSARPVHARRLPPCVRGGSRPELSSGGQA